MRAVISRASDGVATPHQETIRQCLPTSLILDLDSMVEMVYGCQGGAIKGTLSNKPGRKSYHPLLAFEGQTRLNLNAQFRPGNTHPSTDGPEENFILLGERKMTCARFDKDFGAEGFYTLLKSQKISYVGKLKST
ncbi:transposase [Paenibacillus sp. p-8]|uniref:transposase n=1 Tax=Paenibacillus jiagnxiensis TaxID=3228926 RepID=UPI0033A9C6A3